MLSGTSFGGTIRNLSRMDTPAPHRCHRLNASVAARSPSRPHAGSRMRLRGDSGDLVLVLDGRLVRFQRVRAHTWVIIFPVPCTTAGELSRAASIGRGQDVDQCRLVAASEPLQSRTTGTSWLSCKHLWRRFIRQDPGPQTFHLLFRLDFSANRGLFQTAFPTGHLVCMEAPGPTSSRPPSCHYRNMVILTARVTITITEEYGNGRLAMAQTRTDLSVTRPAQRYPLFNHLLDPKHSRLIYSGSNHRRRWTPAPKPPDCVIVLGT